MKAGYVQKGESLNFKNNTKDKIEVGDVVTIGKRIGIAGTDIAPGDVGSLYMEGVYSFDKKDKTAMVAGTEVYLAAEGITETAESNARAGFVVEDSPAEVTSVLVKINA